MLFKKSFEKFILQINFESFQNTFESGLNTWSEDHSVGSFQK